MATYEKIHVYAKDKDEFSTKNAHFQELIDWMFETYTLSSSRMKNILKIQKDQSERILAYLMQMGLVDPIDCVINHKMLTEKYKHVGCWDNKDRDLHGSRNEYRKFDDNEDYIKHMKMFIGRLAYKQSKLKAKHTAYENFGKIWDEPINEPYKFNDKLQYRKYNKK